MDSKSLPVPGPEASRGFEAEILAQAEAAILEADVICLVVDGREGLLPFDEHLAAHIRRCGKPILLAVNKVDGPEQEAAALFEFHALGFPLLAVSAAHGHQVRLLESELADFFPEDAGEISTELPVMRLAMLGRPNAGKSSLVNALVGRNRMIVSEIAGTTRDSVDVSWHTPTGRYVLVDTAGVRRRSRVADGVERFSVNSAIKTTTKADVTLMVIDATQGVAQQDKRLISLLDERKTPFLILVNKIDLVPAAQRRELKEDFSDALSQCRHVPVLPVSALKKSGLEKILPTAHRICEEGAIRVPTSKLNQAMEAVLSRHQPPVVRQARAKFFYLTQAETRPPTFVFFVSDADRVPDHYVRYLENSLRRLLDIRHAPVRIRLRSSHKKNG